MTVIAIILAIVMTGVYLKGIKGFFKSPTKIEREFKSLVDLEKKKNGKEIVIVTMTVLLIIVSVFVFLYYVITASVTGSIVMMLIASLLVIKSLMSTWKMVKYITESDTDYRVGYFGKLIYIVEGIYLIAFFVLLFI